MKKRMIAIILTVAMCIVFMPSMYAKAGNNTENKTEKESYILLCNEQIKDSIKEEYPKLEICNYENSVNVIEAKEGKAQSIQDEFGSEVIIEKDITLKANVNEVDIAEDYESEELWNMQMINSSSNVSFGVKEKVKIAILDSGINYDSEINVVESVNFVEEEIETNPLFIDGSGHGTSVAYVISDYLKANSIYEYVDIYSARVLDDEGNAPVSRIIRSIYWAINR